MIQSPEGEEGEMEHTPSRLGGCGSRDFEVPLEVIDPSRVCIAFKFYWMLNAGITAGD